MDFVAGESDVHEVADGGEEVFFEGSGLAVFVFLHVVPVGDVEAGGIVVLDEGIVEIEIVVDDALVVYVCEEFAVLDEGLFDGQAVDGFLFKKLL